MYHELFDSLPEALRADILGRLQRRTYARGTTVVRHLDDTRDVFFVHTGRARATIYTDSGKVIEYREIHPGGFFGELAAIDALPRSTSVEVVEEAEISRLALGDFRELIETESAFAWAMLTHLSKHIRIMTERILEYSTLLVRERLLRELIRLSAFGEPQGEDGHVIVRPAPTHFDLAARISTHREAVSREMSTLVKSGMLEKRGGALWLDVEALRDSLEG